MSQRLPDRPGICESKSMLTNLGVRHSSFAMSLPSVIRMPVMFPLASTYCIGGRVAFVDIVSVPAVTRSLAPSVGVQLAGAEESLPELEPHAVAATDTAATKAAR